MNVTLTELNEVFSKVFRRPDLMIGKESSASSVEGWDSLTHIELIAAIEKHFGIQFNFNEIMGFQNVGDILTCIDRHLKR
jgi:acyl carrier protein